MNLNENINRIKQMMGLINEESYGEIKDGVQELFNENPILASIGTPEQYSKYLNTIFPNSKVKDIVYHGTDNNNFDNFYENLRSGIHFGSLKQAEGRRIATDFEFKNNYTFIPALLNITNPLKTKDYDWERSGDAFTFWQPGDDLSDVDFSEYLLTSGIANEEDFQNSEGDFDIIYKKGYDGIIYKNEGSGENTGENSFAISMPSQIHILGNKKDIKGFKDFVNK